RPPPRQTRLRTNPAGRLVGSRRRNQRPRRFLPCRRRRSLNPLGPTCLWKRSSPSLPTARSRGLWQRCRDGTGSTTSTSGRCTKSPAGDAASPTRRQHPKALKCHRRTTAMCCCRPARTTVDPQTGPTSVGLFYSGSARRNPEELDRKSGGPKPRVALRKFAESQPPPFITRRSHGAVTQALPLLGAPA